MKFLALCIFICLTSVCNAQTIINLDDTSLLLPVEVSAIRASDKSPVAKTNLSRSQIEKNNIGQDLPFILNQTPSVMVNSDAGNGIGYTGIRIRGSDATRINVTLNGIPYNDAESQGAFFVDLPDIASSAGSIQVQRGVGTSTNGTGAFGGSINISTNELVKKKSFQYNNSIGSYHSFKNTLILNSGLLGKHFTIDGRISDIRSDGYIERAATRLRSLYSAVSFSSGNNSLRLNVISGKEKTYQAWNGVDEQTLVINRRYNSAGTEKPGEPYDNETDNYTQTHYQLFYNHTFDAYWKANAALFLTTGKGYYEQYQGDEELVSYGLPVYYNGQDTVETSDLIRQLWLNNKYYGTIFSLQYNRNKTNVIIGGGWNSYDGKHYGEIIKASVQQAIPENYRWYNLTAFKKDYSAYSKLTLQINEKWQLFADLQGRVVDYKINGFRDNPSLNVYNNYFFFNPKAGLTYSKNQTQAHLYFGRAAKEPNREDFEAGVLQQPKPEILNDFEAGIEYRKNKYFYGVNFYYMFYKDQLVLTGKINDVGAYTRKNIPESYRAGIEFQGAVTLKSWLSVNGNITLSENKIKNFTEFTDDYDNGGQQVKIYAKTDISYSPGITGAASINLLPIKNAGINLMSKYVSSQYLDNTSNRDRMLNAYYLQDVRLNYTWEGKKGLSAILFIQANNIFSKKYEPNGYTFSYIYGGSLTTENYYFPMATFNMIAGVNLLLK